MAENSSSGVIAEQVVEALNAPTAIVPATKTKWYLLRRRGTALITYLLDSEVHTFAFSVSANAILSFIPLVVLLYTLALSVFHSQAMVGVVTEMVNYFLPAATKDPNWVATTILKEAVMPLMTHKGVQIFSLVMILISCTGIFLPLEVALNQAWGVAKSRNYLMNQVIAFGLAFLMVVLAMMAILLNAGAQGLLTVISFHHTDNFVFRTISYVFLSATTGAASIVCFFAVYWLLPNRKVPPRHVFRTAVLTGLVWLGAKMIFVEVLPHLDLQALYGPFYVSVGLLLWAYVSGLILFAGAQLSVARFAARKT